MIFFCCLLIFSKSTLPKKFYQEYHHSVKIFDSDQNIGLQTVCEHYLRYEFDFGMFMKILNTSALLQSK